MTSSPTGGYTSKVGRPAAWKRIDDAIDTPVTREAPVQESPTDGSRYPALRLGLVALGGVLLLAGVYRTVETIIGPPQPFL